MVQLIKLLIIHSICKDVHAHGFSFTSSSIPIQQKFPCQNFMLHVVVTRTHTVASIREKETASIFLNK